MSDPFVFVSYSTQDNDFAQRLTQDLQKAGIEVWIDKHGLKAGTPDWENAIREAIRNASAILLVASPDSRDSRYVRDELLIAEMYERSVIAIWAKGERWPECVRMGYIGTQYADAREINYQVGLLETVNALRAFMSLPVIEKKLSVKATPSNFKSRNPYKGLRAFNIEDKGDFFGRDKLIDELVNIVKECTDFNRFLTVVGSSGSGKSSLVMAGLIPHLQQGELPESDKWIYLEPVLPGSQPLESLAITLSNALNLTIGSVIDELDRSSRSLSLFVKQITKGRRDRRVVLLIDQFEELFTQTIDEDKRSHFIDLIVTAATEDMGQTIIISTLRADFYDRPMRYPELGKLLEKRSKFVLPMSIEDLRDVIEKPAALLDVQLRFEDGLIGDLLFEVRGQLGALPLLQFTLEQLVEKHRDNLLTNQAYHEIGGVKGALAKHAEETYQKLSSDQHREMTRFLFLRLIETGLTDQDTTRRRTLQSDLVTQDHEITTILQEVLVAFNDARLLTTSLILGVPTVEVSHETLIREWQRLAAWTEEAREDIKIQNAINFDSQQWVLHQKRIDDLYRGKKLAEAREWLKRNIPSLIENEFIISAMEEEAKSILAQKLLSVSEEKKTQFIDNSTYLLASLDNSFHYTYVGNAFHRILSYLSKELIGHNMFELIHADDREMVSVKILQVVDKHQPDVFEFRFRHHDGYYLWLETVISPSIDKNDDLSGLIVTAQDVSERRWMQRAMLEQEKLLVMLQKEQEFTQFRKFLGDKMKLELFPTLELIQNANSYIGQLTEGKAISSIIEQTSFIENEVLQALLISKNIATLLDTEVENGDLND